MQKFPVWDQKASLWKALHFVWIASIAIPGVTACRSQRDSLSTIVANPSAHSETDIPQAGQGPRAGRYAGYARRTGGTRKFHMTMDLAFVGKNNYRVFVRLSPGVEESAEYTSYYFSEGVYQTKTLQFRNPSIKDIWGILNTVGSSQLKGSFNSHKTGKVLVDFELTSVASLAQGAMPPPVHTPAQLHEKKNTRNRGLSGFYTAQQCAPHIRGLYLEGYKESSETPVDLGHLQVSGRLVQQDDILCRGKGICLAESYTKGFFEPFSGSIFLDGWMEKRTCMYNQGLITCDLPCSFSKVLDNPSMPLDELSARDSNDLGGPQPDDQAYFAGVNSVPITPEPARSGASLGSLYQGQFYGYLYHKALGAFQLLALSLEPTEDRPQTLSNPLYPMATLYFGEGDSPEFIAFPFFKFDLPQGRDPIVFEGTGDGMLIVRRWTKDVIWGDWYSKSFGYVGPLNLHRGNVPTLPREAKLLQPLSGGYLGAGSTGAPWNLEITAASEVSDRGGAFYPLRLYGYAKEQIDFARRRLSERGSYHFYTGRVFLRLDDQRVIIGQTRLENPSRSLAEEQSSRGESPLLELFWSPNPRVGTDVGQGKGIVFRKSEPYPEPRAQIFSRGIH